MKKTLVFGALGLALFALATLACNKDNTSSSNYLDQADCTGIDVSTNTYTFSIKTILNNNCATSSCHSASRAEAGINLSSYSAAKSAFENTNCLCSIHQGSTCRPMPEGAAKLSDAVIQKIDCWAKNGYQE